MSLTFEQLLGRTLGLGVAVSTALLAMGLLIYLVRPGPAADLLFNGGLVALMGTPMLRVALSCVEYVRERDWFFAVNALGVLAVLLLTIWTAWSQ